MSNENEIQFSSDLERFLDSLMTSEEESTYREQHLSDAPVQQAIELQSQLDQSLLNLFPSDEMSDQLKSRIIDNIQARPSDFTLWTRASFLKAAVVALVLIAATAAWNGFFNQKPEPFFQQVALVQLHQDLNQQGYQPYYNCEDEERFAAVFKKRQNVALKLTPMPVDRKMLGISYLGGLSRQTTAMLATVDNENVTVFVDRKSALPEPNIVNRTETLNVFKREMSNLVLYEISPFKEAKLLDHFEALDPQD